MLESIVRLNEAAIKGQILKRVRGSVEETLNGLLKAEAEKLTQERPGRDAMSSARAIAVGIPSPH